MCISPIYIELRLKTCCCKKVCFLYMHCPLFFFFLLIRKIYWYEISCKMQRKVALKHQIGSTFKKRSLPDPGITSMIMNEKSMNAKLLRENILQHNWSLCLASVTNAPHEAHDSVDLLFFFPSQGSYFRRCQIQSYYISINSERMAYFLSMVWMKKESMNEKLLWENILCPHFPG